jgi:hypothetical protein
MNSLEFYHRSVRPSDIVGEELKRVKNIKYSIEQGSFFHGEYIARYSDGTTFFRQCRCDSGPSSSHNSGEVYTCSYNEMQEALDAEKEKEDLIRLIDEVDKLIDPKKIEARGSKKEKREMKQVSSDVDQLSNSLRAASKTKRKLQWEPTNKRYKV